MRIGLISDTHGDLEDSFLRFFDHCDEIWHAGDIGNPIVIEKLQAFKPLKAVFGNIDDHKMRGIFPENEIFVREGLKVFITHIGGYPGKYNPSALQIIKNEKPGIFVCGHSHILKVKWDPRFQLLHMNPGAAGNHGWHQVKTAIRFEIQDGKPCKAEILEIPRKSLI